ncbi:intercellular adhesion molecule 5-like [Cuculus canorus]|uniref:intercellular adhesion molecule 5-like n=1 Tax=Cuculus canorus TaxID=55661 RepID=UPI0023AB205E|nr:intercellular adhesion molecule 5-like [Cuculus canorus]
MELRRSWGAVALLYLLLRGGRPDPCRVSIAPEDPIVELGSSILFNCTSSCSNPTRLNWEVSVTKLGTRGPTWVSLEIPNITDWSLEIQCFGVFGERRVVTSTTLRAYRLEPPQISLPDEVVLGRPTLLTCTARAQGPPSAPPNVLLSLWGRGVPPGVAPSSSSSPLKLGFVARAEQHGRDVTCEATLWLRGRRLNASAGVTLWVWAPPHHVHVWSPHSTFAAGDNVTVRCRAEGNPSPRIHWELPSNTSLELGDNGTTVTIPAARREHGGTYHCVATNRYGTGTASIDIPFQGSPRSPLIPVAVTLAVLSVAAVLAGSWWLYRVRGWKPMLDGSQHS